MKRTLNKNKNPKRVKLVTSGPIKLPALLTSSLAESIDKYPVLKFLRDNQNESNRLMCELRMSLFVEAASYPFCRESGLQPFPTCFLDPKTNTKDFAGLLSQVETVPRFSDIFADSTQLPPLTWELLNCVFNNSLTLDLLVTDIPAKIIEIKRTTGLVNFLTPNNTNVFVFSISLSEPRPKFAEAKKQYGTRFAYHGSPVRNFHSIINRGLLCALNVNSHFGHGTYLCTILDYSRNVHYTLYGQGWTHSSFGNAMQCVAVVEVAMSPDTTLHSKDLIYLCDNDDHMQLTHLIVYCN